MKDIKLKYHFIFEREMIFRFVNVLCMGQSILKAYKKFSKVLNSLSFLVQICKGGSFYSDFKLFLRTVSRFVPLCQSTRLIKWASDPMCSKCKQSISRSSSSRFNCCVSFMKIKSPAYFHGNINQYVRGIVT